MFMYIHLMSIENVIKSTIEEVLLKNEKKR